MKQVTIGFSAVARLLSRRVDAVPAFWNAEGVALKAKGRDVSEFRVEDYGAPPYPEVVLVTSRKTLDEKRDALKRTLKAISQGMEATLADLPGNLPGESLDAASRRAARLRVRLQTAEASEVTPAFLRRVARDGFDMSDLLSQRYFALAPAGEIDRADTE